MRVAIVGCAHIHTRDAVEAIQKTPDVDVVGVWDHQRKRAEYWADKFGAPILSDPGAGCADAIIVLSETRLHAELIQSVANKPLFIEKPLGTIYREAQYIMKVIHWAGKPFHTGYFLREMESMRRLRSLVQDNAFGDIARVRMLFSHNGFSAGWFEHYDWMLIRDQAGYGGFGDLGVHLVDLVTWMFDSPVSTLTASLRTLSEGLDVEDVGEAQLRLKNGTVAAIGAGIVEPGPTLELSISGSRGYATLRDGVLTVDTVSTSFQQPMEAPNAASSIQHFLESIKGCSPDNLVPVSDAALHCKILDACYLASSQNSWINVSA